jgi:hypothetical protein
MNPLKTVAKLFRSTTHVGGARIPSQIVLNDHDVVITTAPLSKEGAPHRPSMSWHSSDTSVIRLEVSDDTLSARGIRMGVGRAVVTISDGETMEVHAIVVEDPQPVKKTSLRVTMKKVGRDS